MNKIKTLVLTVSLLSAFSVSAQYTQNRPSCEYMLKVEVGYMANAGNYGTPKNAVTTENGSLEACGYNLNLHEQGVGLNIINGANISQDFFLGGGLGYTYLASFGTLYSSKASHEAHAFIDMDFRPVGDIWAPMLGVRLGGSFLMNPWNYGNTISPYAEFYAGINWFYDHTLQQMNRNYHSLFLEVGVVLQQQTVFIPIRLGWRL